MGQHGVGELGISRQGCDLEEDAQGEVGRVDVGERPDLVAMAGQQRQCYVEDEQEEEHCAHAEANVAAHKGATVPPAAASGLAFRLSLRHHFRFGLHQSHAGTMRPLGPAMLRAWPCRASSPRATPFFP